MKTSFLVCSVLLAAAGCSAEQGGLAAASSEAIVAGENLAGETFLSTETFAHRTYGGQDIQAHLRLKFVPVEDSYTLDGVADAGLEYEVYVEWVDAATGTAETADSTFYARKGQTSGTFDFFDCDSTSTCETNYKTQLTVDAKGNALLANENLLSIFYHEGPKVIALRKVK